MTITIKYLYYDKTFQFNSFEQILNYDEVVHINCYGSQLSILPKLPNSLRMLSCYYNQLSVLPELPNSLQYLWCFNNKISVLPELPNSLQYIDCRNNKFIKKIKHKYLTKMIYL